jgi:hypothetical protein
MVLSAPSNLATEIHLAVPGHPKRQESYRGHPDDWALTNRQNGRHRLFPLDSHQIAALKISESTARITITAIYGGKDAENYQDWFASKDGSEDD